MNKAEIKSKLDCEVQAAETLIKAVDQQIEQLKQGELLLLQNFRAQIKNFRDEKRSARSFV